MNWSVLTYESHKNEIIVRFDVKNEESEKWVHVFRFDERCHSGLCGAVWKRLKRTASPLTSDIWMQQMHFSHFFPSVRKIVGVPWAHILVANWSDSFGNKRLVSACATAKLQVFLCGPFGLPARPNRGPLKLLDASEKYYTLQREVKFPISYVFHLSSQIKNLLIEPDE